LFEVGPQYADDSPEGQTTVAGGVRSGLTNPRSWIESAEPVDVFHAKADVLAALRAAGTMVNKLKVTKDTPSWYHPGRSGTLCLGRTVIAQFGELHPSICSAMNVEGPIAAFEAFVDRLPSGRSQRVKAKPLLSLSQFQPVRRDFAFLVDENVEAGNVLQAVTAVDRDLITNAELFDVYREGVGEGKKSLAVTVTMQPIKATMTEEEIETVADKIVANVSKITGGTLRS